MDGGWNLFIRGFFLTEKDRAIMCMRASRKFRQGDGKGAPDNVSFFSFVFSVINVFHRGPYGPLSRSNCFSHSGPAHAVKSDISPFIALNAYFKYCNLIHEKNEG